MEKIKTETAAAPAATEAATDEVKVVIMGAGPVPEALRKAFPNAEFIDTEAPTGAVEEEAPLELLAEIGETLAKLRAATREGCCQHQSLFSEEKLRGEPVPVEVEKQMRKVAYGKLMQIAGSYGLGFNEQELDAFYRLSLATNPNVAMHAAQVACKDFLGKWEN